MEISKLHRKTADCTFASVAHSIFVYGCLCPSHEGNFHCGRLATLLRKLLPRGWGVPKWRVPGQRGVRPFLEASSNWHRCMERCHWFVIRPRCQGFLTTQRSYLSETSRPLRKKLQRYGPHWEQREKVQTSGGGVVCTPSLNLQTNGHTEWNS